MTFTNDLEQETYIALKSSIMTLTLRASAWEMRWTFHWSKKVDIC